MACFVESVDVSRRIVCIRSDSAEYQKRMLDIRSQDAVQLAQQAAIENSFVPPYIRNQTSVLLDTETGKRVGISDMGKYNTVEVPGGHLHGAAKLRAIERNVTVKKLEDDRLQPELRIEFASSPSATFIGDSYPATTESK